MPHAICQRGPGEVEEEEEEEDAEERRLAWPRGRVHLPLARAGGRKGGRRDACRVFPMGVDRGARLTRETHIPYVIVHDCA